jgi:hypothetical protein
VSSGSVLDGAGGGAGASPSVSSSNGDEGRSTFAGGGESWVAGSVTTARAGGASDTGCVAGVATGSAVVTGRAVAGVGRSADVSAEDRAVVTVGNGCGANFDGGVFGSNGGGSVVVLTWSRIEDDSSGIEDDSPGLGALSNAEIVDVAGFGGGSANARSRLPSPILGPSTIPATTSNRLRMNRLGARAPFERFRRAVEVELELMTLIIESISKLGVNPGRA